MGQEISTGNFGFSTTNGPDEDILPPGFKKKEEKILKKSTPTLGMKSNVKTKPKAVVVRDAYMERVQVTDHIQPIYEDNVSAGRLEESLEGSLEVTKLLEDARRRRIEKKETLIEPVELPEIESSESVHSSDEDGMAYLHEYQDEQSEELDIKSAKSHPICISGELTAFATLQVVDQSSFSHVFPITSFKWHLSTYIGESTAFELQAYSNESTFTLPACSIGRFVSVHALRMVEDQLEGTVLRTPDGGVYDPHIGDVYQTNFLPTKKKIVVESYAVTGPVHIPDIWALQIMKALSKNHYKCSVSLWDKTTNQVSEVSTISQGTVKKNSKNHCEIPAIMALSDDKFSFMFNDETEVEVGGFFERAPFWAQELFQTDKKTTVTRKDTFSLSDLHFRQGKSSKTIVVHLKTDSNRNTSKNCIRFDPNETVSRDLVFFVLIGFQAALKKNQFNRKSWQKALEIGDLQKAQKLVLEYLIDTGTQSYDVTPGLK